jgi:hypothetical protein
MESHKAKYTGCGQMTADGCLRRLSSSVRYCLSESALRANSYRLLMSEISVARSQCTSNANRLTLDLLVPPQQQARRRLRRHLWYNSRRSGARARHSLHSAACRLSFPMSLAPSIQSSGGSMTAQRGLIIVSTLDHSARCRRHTNFAQATRPLAASALSQTTNPRAPSPCSAPLTMRNHRQRNAQLIVSLRC